MSTNTNDIFTSTEDQKLAQVKKSCKTTATIVHILEVILWVGTILMIVGGGTMIAFSDKIMAALQETGGSLNYSFQAGGVFSVIMNHVDAGSDARAVGIMMLLNALVTCTGAVLMLLIRKAFDGITRSNSPFTDQVMKRMKVCFILMTIIVFVSVGIGFALMTGLVLRSFYCIMDYGRVLQQQADETL